MNVHDAIRARRSVRLYKNKPIPDDKLRRVLEAGRLAPSARNMQDWKFIVVRDPETRAKLSEAAKGQQSVAQASVVIVACATQTDYVMTCGNPAHLIDVPIAIDHMTLAAVEEGLGTCWIGAFYQDKVKEILGIPEDIQVIELLPLGWPDESPTPTPRRELDDVFVFEKWQ